MSKHIKLEDALKEFNYGTDYPVNTIIDILYDLPTIEVSEDCISREYIKTLFESNLTGTCKDAVVHIIANAPSVVPKDKCKVCQQYDIGFEDGRLDMLRQIIDKLKLSEDNK